MIPEFFMQCVQIMPGKSMYSLSRNMEKQVIVKQAGGYGDGRSEKIMIAMDFMDDA